MELLSISGSHNASEQKSDVPEDVVSGGEQKSCGIVQLHDQSENCLA